MKYRNVNKNNIDTPATAFKCSTKFKHIFRISAKRKKARCFGNLTPALSADFRAMIILDSFDQRQRLELKYFFEIQSMFLCSATNVQRQEIALACRAVDRGVLQMTSYRKQTLGFGRKNRQNGGCDIGSCSERGERVNQSLIGSVLERNGDARLSVYG